MKADSFAELPSYLRANVCGTGTPNACPNRAVPTPRKGSRTIGPNDLRLPVAVRQRQGLLGGGDQLGNDGT